MYANLKCKTEPGSLGKDIVNINMCAKFHSKKELLTVEEYHKVQTFLDIH